MKRQIKTDDEQDAYTVWRRWYPYLRRAGKVRRIKRRTHRRERREARREIVERLREYQEGT